MAGASLNKGEELEDLGTIREYELLAKLGQGGMGLVFLANDVELDDAVALTIADNRQRGKSKLTTALDYFGDAIDGDQLLNEVIASLILFISCHFLVLAAKPPKVLLN